MKKSQRKELNQELKSSNNSRTRAYMARRILPEKNSNLRNEFFDSVELYFGDIIENLRKSLKRNELLMQDQKRREALQNEWSDVARILDRILCYFFVISTLLVCVLIFLDSPHTMSSW